MSEHFEEPAAEIKHLQRCINDLVSILALPAMWSGSSPSRIVQTLLDSLLSILRLDLVYVRLKDPDGTGFIEMAKIAQSSNLIALPGPPGEILKRSLGDVPSKWPPNARVVFGETEISVATVRLGIHDEIGVIVAGAERADFPGQTETLLLSVAANQAAIGLQEARLLTEQKRVAGELDRRVAERTAELAAVNDELKTEVAERRRVEEALRASEVNARLIVDSIPGLVCAMSPVGEVNVFNRQILEFFGKTPEEMKAWSTSDAVHPDDLPRVVAAFTNAITTGTPYDVDTAAAGPMAPIDGFRFARLPCLTVTAVTHFVTPAGTSC